MQILSPSMILAKARKGYTDKLGRTWKWNGVKYEYVRKGRGKGAKKRSTWEANPKIAGHERVPPKRGASRGGVFSDREKKDYSDLDTKDIKKKLGFVRGAPVHITRQGKAGSEGTTYGIETVSGSHMHEMFFDSPLEAKKYAEKQGYKVRRMAGDALTVKGTSDVEAVREQRKKDWTTPKHLDPPDHEDLAAIRDAVKAGKLTRARRLVTDLDTIVRDEVPADVLRKLWPPGSKGGYQSREDAEAERK